MREKALLSQTTQNSKLKTQNFSLISPPKCCIFALSYQMTTNH